jgi:hypothetical protein
MVNIWIQIMSAERELSWGRARFQIFPKKGYSYCDFLAVPVTLCISPAGVYIFSGGHIQGQTLSMKAVCSKVPSVLKNIRGLPLFDFLSMFFQIVGTSYPNLEYHNMDSETIYSSIIFE